MVWTHLAKTSCPVHYLPLTDCFWHLLSAFENWKLALHTHSDYWGVALSFEFAFPWLIFVHRPNCRSKTNCQSSFGFLKCSISSLLLTGSCGIAVSDPDSDHSPSLSTQKDSWTQQCSSEPSRSYSTKFTHHGSVSCSHCSSSYLWSLH